ncbi:variable surface lipoprotein [Mycoplasma phocimorsus]|uniref:variable surface lipoprotein n=1 Tax=Mycoplasma phocimorsus TaxID=3045839 RepID=UPI0024BF1E4B|nr:variable surface lipoprotein [Mycoplasma phocimorsus]MDJ1648991.1 variable surface lipoprotein [Mycoplasma phocimorsus]
MKKNKMILSILALSTLISTPLISLSCIKTQTKDEFRAQVEDSLEFNNEEINIHQLDKLNVSSDAIWFNNQEVVYSIRNPKIVTSSVTGKQHVELTIAVKDKQTSNVIFTIKRQLSSFKEISENDWEEIIKNYNKQTKFEWNTPEEVNYNLNITHKDVKVINDNAKRVEVVSVSSTYDEIVFGYKLHFATPDAKERESELFISRVKKDQLGRPVVTFSYNNNETTQNIVTNIHNQIDEPVGIKEDQKILKALYLDEEQNVEVKFINGKSDYKFTKNTTLYPKFVEPTIIYVLNQNKIQDSNRTITLGANGKVNKKQLSLREWGGPAISAKKKVGNWYVWENDKEEKELDFDEEGNSTRVFEDGETYKIFPKYIDAEAAKFNLLTQKGKSLGQVKGTSDGKLPNLASYNFGKDNPELDGKEPESFYLDKEFKRPISRALSFKNDTVNDVYVKFKNMVKVELYPINAPSNMNNTNYYFYINSKYKAVESSLAEKFDPESLLSENEKSGNKFYSYDYLVNNLNIKDENPEESESYALVLRNDPELEPVDINEFSTLYNWYRNKDTVQLIAIAQEPYEKKVKKARGVFLSILDSFKKVNHAILNDKFGIAANSIYGSNDKNFKNEEYWKISTTKKLEKEQRDYSYIDNYIEANGNNSSNNNVTINWELQVNAAIEIMELATNLLLGGAYTYKQLENFINNLTTRLELLLLYNGNGNGKGNAIRLFMQNLRFAVIKIVKKNRKYLDSTGQFFVNNDGVAEKPDIDSNKNKVVELDTEKTYDELEYDGARLYSIEFPKKNGKENEGQQVSTDKKRVVKIELGNGPKYIIYSIFDHIMAQVTRWVELYGRENKATKIRDVFELFIGRFTSVGKEGEEESKKVNTSIDNYYFREANSFDNKNIESTSYRWRLDSYSPKNGLYLKYQSIVRGMWELIDKYNNDNNINELIDGIQDLIPKLIRAINIIGNIWSSHNGGNSGNKNGDFQEGTIIKPANRYAIENIVEQLIGRKSIYRQLIIKDK